MKKISVLIIDDSAVVRTILTEILSTDENIEVVGTAMDPHIAREKIKRLNPDVLTLDVEMPKMDGLSFLSNLMRLRPMPVVMISSLTEEGADVTLKALGLGAVDFVGKPKLDVAHQLESYSKEIIAKVKAAATAKIHPYLPEKAESARKSRFDPDEIEKRYTTTMVLQRSPLSKHKATEKIIAIGASTGGTEAIKDILLLMSADFPGTLIAQHIPPAFSSAFAKRMDSISRMVVSEAEDGQIITQGHVYIAPGDRHLMLVRDGARYRCELNDGPPVNRHKPSVDVMFRSVAQSAGLNAIGVLLTGMGADGARGLLELHDAGAPTIVQDEKSSVVWGMPGEAVKLNAADHVLPIDGIEAKIGSLLNN